jgi:hypothetical protein
LNTLVNFESALPSISGQFSVGVNTMGNWTNPALVEILQNSDDRAIFLADDTVKLFIKEQNALDSVLPLTGVTAAFLFHAS